MPPRYNYRRNLATIIPCGRGVVGEIINWCHLATIIGATLLQLSLVVAASLVKLSIIGPPAHCESSPRLIHWCHLATHCPSSLRLRINQCQLLVATIIHPCYPSLVCLLIPNHRCRYNLINWCHLALLLIAINQCQAAHCPSSLPRRTVALYNYPSLD